MEINKVEGEKNRFKLRVKRKIEEGNNYVAKLAIRNNLPDYGYIIVRRTKTNGELGYIDTVHSYDTLIINTIKIY